MLQLLRLIFPNAGWYVYYQQDFSPVDRLGPFNDRGSKEDLYLPNNVFNSWVRFRLW